MSEGEVHGFLGPNGAGKTTTIRILLGLLRRDAGAVELLGGDPWRDASTLHRRLAYVPGEVSLWPNLTGGEVIDLLGELRRGLDETRRAHLLERFALDPTKRCRTYSKGNRQKVAVVAAFASDVELYLLDEPTSGLDSLMGRPVDGLAGMAGVHDLTHDGQQIRFTVDEGEINHVLERLVALDVRSITSTPPTLEELFLRHYDEVAGAR